jgi:hypothetical protein
MKVTTSKTFQAFLKWLGEHLFRQPEEPAPPPAAVGVRPPSERPDSNGRVLNQALKRPDSAGKTVRLDTTVKGEIADGGPGKNVLIRKFVREETGTHDTLKILDQSVFESDEGPGIDPYNTGRFDRAKSWETRFRK